MKLRALVAAIALVAIPIAVQGAEPRQTDNRVTPKGCQAQEATGSRLGSTLRCRTRPARTARREAPRPATQQAQTQNSTGGGEAPEQSANQAPQF